MKASSPTPAARLCLGVRATAILGMHTYKGREPWPSHALAAAIVHRPSLPAPRLPAPTGAAEQSSTGRSPVSAGMKRSQSKLLPPSASPG
jgi:hypothetical protein